MTTTSLADAKNRLSEIIASAEKTHERTIVTKNGKPVAIVLSIEDFEGMEMTLEILSDPETMADLEESKIESRFGIFHTQPEIQLMIDRRLAGNPMTDEEMENLMAERMGKDAYDTAQRGVAEALKHRRWPRP